jgi:hypothetical protein
MPTRAGSPNIGELESKLAGYVRSYIDHASTGNASMKQEALRWVCAGLERLLGELLEGDSEWIGWVDGILPATDILPDTVDVISSTAMSIRGSALWGKNAAGPFWIEPFACLVEITNAQDILMNYELRLGDAAEGLGRVPYIKHVRKPQWFRPAQWLFTFRKRPTPRPQPLVP